MRAACDLLHGAQVQQVLADLLFTEPELRGEVDCPARRDLASAGRVGTGIRRHPGIYPEGSAPFLAAQSRRPICRSEATVRALISSPVSALRNVARSSGTL